MNLTRRTKNAKGDIGAEGLPVLEAPAAQHQKLGVLVSWREILAGR